MGRNLVRETGKVPQPEFVQCVALLATDRAEPGALVGIVDAIRD